MTSPAGSQNSSPTDPAAPADPEAGRIKSLDDRFGKIEAEQQRQGGILSRIEAALGGSPKAPGSPGGPGGPASPSSPGQSSPPESPSVAEQVRKGVEEIEAEKARKAKAEADADAEKSWKAYVDQQLAERQPAEPGTGFRDRLQRALVGKPDPK